MSDIGNNRWFNEKVLGNTEPISSENVVTEKQKQVAMDERLMKTNLVIGDDKPLDIEKYESAILENGDILGDEIFKEVKYKKRKMVGGDYVPKEVREAFEKMDYTKLPKKYNLKIRHSKLGFDKLDDIDYILVVDRCFYANNPTVLMEKFKRWQFNQKESDEKYPNTVYKGRCDWKIHIVYEDEKAYIKRVK